MVELAPLREPVPVRRVSLESTAKRRTVENSARTEVSAVGVIIASAHPDFTETIARKGKRISFYTNFHKISQNYFRKGQFMQILGESSSKLFKSFPLKCASLTSLTTNCQTFQVLQDLCGC